MPNYIAIDGGTTNTRISLVAEGQILEILSFHVGAVNGIDNKTVLKETIKDGISAILERNGLKPEEITCILASGMITSEFGLLELARIQTPAGVRELHETMQGHTFEEITSIPFTFIRGVETGGTTPEDTDMMRGEEAELTGIFRGEGIYILPGSHSKIIETDALGRITGFKTMLTGEMIAAIAGGTILKDTVELKEYPLHQEALIQGMEYTRAHGINDALFKVRVLKNIFGQSPSELYHFYLGVLLSAEIEYILSLNPQKIFIGGRKAIKDAMAVLLRQFTEAEVYALSEAEVEGSSTLGKIKIYEYQERNEES